MLLLINVYFFPQGHNGTIDGQGKTWWSRFQHNRLKHTRGPLVQIMWSRDIVISNITLRNPPFWTLHPYDCKNVIISNVTILAPVLNAPNTDGIDPGKHVSFSSKFIPYFPSFVPLMCKPHLLSMKYMVIICFLACRTIK